MRYPTWQNFEAKYSENPQGAFESLCRMLFRKRYGIGETLPYYYNNAGNETVPIESNGDVVGFQAKYFSGETLDDNHIRQIKHSIERAHAHYPKQNKIIVYTNLLFGNPPEGKENPPADRREVRAEPADQPEAAGIPEPAGEGLSA